MRQAIVTKFHAATNTYDARVTATCQAGRVTLPWNDSLDVPDNHTAAAKALQAKFGWSGKLAGGAMPDGTGYCFVLLPETQS